MSYNYYRYAPGWGTHQFQIGAPPLPAYQPLPSWTGQDFYSAHAMGFDPDYYHNTISRLSSGMGGFGKHEARMWHRRAYAGLGEVTRMMPQEIGAAAAYEAYRQVKYGTNVYQFLYSDYERQREALRALAIAEAVSLWQDTGRAVDQYGLQMACDEAAATATNIITERELDDGYGMGFGGSHRSRRNSFNAYPVSGYASSGGYAGSAYAGSAYGGGSPLMMGGNLPPSPLGGAMPMPGAQFPGIPYTSSVGMGMPMYGGYAGSYGSPGYDYLGGYASLPGTPAAVLLAPPEDHHRHRHRHRHRRHRHRSHDRY
ncbi:hypothetical protein F5148DRAFT_1224467 [Russula earlei]|uniref:Uncharacterized protein n=1 Tax=Russula earlei TaxID=71964 RepID=A0ACC0U0F3_9AGAM|nr:hypothetical protein F5148DRAFT_1224467 [Russula earlei]